MIDAIAACERVVNYIDIPLQHINDRVLKVMGRRVTHKQTETLLKKIRYRIPASPSATTFIIGFPGETDGEFEELVSFVRGFGFDAVGAFHYSHEPGTPAFRIGDPPDDAVINERYERLMLAQQEVALSAAQRRVGQMLEVLVDGVLDDDGTLAGPPRQARRRKWTQSVSCRRTPPEPGDFVEARCVDTDGYDLLVRPASIA